jgi:outer membrane immunogenic protein
MKSILFAAAALIAASSARSAFADTGSDTEYGSWGIYNWEGTYAGVTGSYGWSKQGIDSATLGHPSYDADGPIFGVTLGANADTGEWIFGMEGDVAWADLNGSAACGAFSCKSKVDALGTARARVGYEIQKWLGTYPLLAYATGGVAFGETRFKASGPGGTSDTGKVEAGWVVGGGLEYALGDRWSLKSEYLHVDLGDDNYHLNGVPVTGKIGSIDLVRGGVNYRF